MEYPTEDPEEIAHRHKQQQEFGRAVRELQIALYHLEDDSCVTARAYGATHTALDIMESLVEEQKFDYPQKELQD